MPKASKNGPKSKTKTPDVFNLYCKKEEMLQHGKHALADVFETYGISNLKVSII